MSIGIGSSTPEVTDPEAIAVAEAQWELEIARRGGEILRNLDFPVYAARGRLGTVGEWSRDERGRTTSVTVQHEEPSQPRAALHITTEREQHSQESEVALARGALERLHYAANKTALRSHAGATIWLQTQRRAWRRVAATAVITESATAIDAENAAFSVAATETSWAAVRRHRDLLITVTA